MAHLSCGILANLGSKFGTENGKEIFALTRLLGQNLANGTFMEGLNLYQKSYIFVI